MGEWVNISGWVWLMGCTNPQYMQRVSGSLVTFAHVYLADDPELARASRACKHCGTPVMSTYALDRKTRCAACQRVILPWVGMLCPDCGWPMQRMQCHLAEKDGEQQWHTKKIVK